MYLSNPKNHITEEKGCKFNIGTNIIENGYLFDTSIRYHSINCIKYLFKTFLSQFLQIFNMGEPTDNDDPLMNMMVILRIIMILLVWQWIKITV